MHQNTAQTAEQTTEQKAEQNRRTDTNNAERLDEIEIASSGLDPSFLVERPTNTTHFRSVDFTPRSRSLCPGSHNTNPFGPVEGTAGVTSLLGLAAIALFFTFAIDGILGALRKTLRIRPGALSYKGRGLSADVASGYKYGSILGNTFFLLFVCLVLGLILYTFIDNAILPAISQGSVAVRPASLVFLGTYASYPFLLRPVLRRLSAQLGGISTVSKVLPFYSLIPGGLTIDFKVKQFGGRPRSWIAKMGFDELDEVRQFNSYFEATAFLEYSVGPDVKMQVRRSVDLYRWAKGEISRPSVLARIDSRRNPVLLNGKNIFYLISFQGNDVTDLVGAFHTFKESPTSISPS